MRLKEIGDKFVKEGECWGYSVIYKAQRHGRPTLIMVAT